MAEILLSRIDNRLIHGVVAVKWIPHLKISKVIIIDDVISKDPYLIALQKLASPLNVDSIVVDSSTAAYYWKKNRFGSGRALVLFHNISNAYDSYRKGFHFSSLQIGNLPTITNDYMEFSSLRIARSDQDLLVQLTQSGVFVYHQYTPSQAQKPFRPQQT